MPSLSMSSRNMSFMNIWNVAGELHSPKNMTVGSKSPNGVLKAAFHWSPFLIRILLYPFRRSSLVKNFACWSLSIRSAISGSGYAFRIVPVFSFL